MRAALVIVCLSIAAAGCGDDQKSATGASEGSATYSRLTDGERGLASLSDAMSALAHGRTPAVRPIEVPQNPGPATEADARPASALEGQLRKAFSAEADASQSVELIGERAARVSRLSGDKAELADLRSAIETLELTESELGKLRRELGTALTALRAAARAAQIELRGGSAPPKDKDLGRALDRREVAIARADAALNARLSELDRRLSARVQSVTTSPAVEGPFDCGLTSAGSKVVVNAGRISCKEAIRVATNSSGPNSATGPAGWDCSGLAVDLNGDRLAETDGHQCTSTVAAISIFLASATPPAPAKPSSEDCPAGQEFVTPYESPAGTGRCVVVEGAESGD